MPSRKSTSSLPPTTTSPTNATSAGSASAVVATEAQKPAPSKSATEEKSLTKEGDGTTTGTTTANAEPKSPTTTKAKRRDSLGIDDLLLPRSLISRLARGTLPPNTSLQRDAILAITKSATVFISYLAAAANEQTSKKTITSADVLRAVREVEMAGVMGLDHPPVVKGEEGEEKVVDRRGRLEREVEVWEEGVRGKRRGYREKVRARESGVGDGEEGDSKMLGSERNGDDGEPDRKKVRRGPGEEGEEEREEEDNEDDLLDAQLNGTSRDGKELGDGDEEEGDDEEEEDEDETEDEEQERDGQERDLDVDVDDDRGGRVVLAPNGRAEVGSEDESD